MSDLEKRCKSCGESWLYTEAEQAKFAGTYGTPTHCHDCRKARKEAKARGER